MSMSDDPRYRRGQGGHQRQPAPQGREGRPERSAAQQQRGFGQPDPTADRDDGRQPSFSAYRPEAYAGAGKGSPRQDWDRGRSGAPRTQSPAADAYPRPAPERPGAQPDPRDPYRNAADPYAAPQQDYEADWRQSYPEAGGFNDDSGYQDAGGRFANYYEEPPQVNDMQAVHDRFFAHEPEQDVGATRYRGVVDQNVVDYPEAQYDAGAAGSGYGGGYDSNAFTHQPQQRAPYPADDPYPADQDYTWESYDHAPPPQSVRPPYQAPIAGRDDDLDADFFADEDEFENEDYQEERGGGRKKLMAAVLAGAVVTGLGLGFLYKNGSSTGTGGEPPVVAADAGLVKEAPRAPGGKQFPGGNKLIQDRLGGSGSSGEESAPGTSLASAQADSGNQMESSPAVITTTGSGTLEERIKNALRDAKNPDADGATQAESADAPQRVRTMTFNPDGSIAGGGDSGSSVRRFEAPSSQSETSPNVVVTTSEETQPAADQRVAVASPQPVQVTESTVRTGDYFVQVGARNVQEDAIKAFAIMQQKYAAVLGNYSPVVRKVDLGEKGIWYRLRVGPFETRDAADQLCSDLKTAGWKQCFSAKD